MSCFPVFSNNLTLFYRHKHDPKSDPAEPLTEADLKPANEMKKMVMEYRSQQLREKV